MRKLPCLTLFLVLCAGAVSARADEDGKATSRELNAAATKAMDAGDLPTALRRFHEAYEAYPSPNLHFNLGLVLDKLGRHAEAADELQAFLDGVPNAPADAQKFARDKVTALAVTLGHVTLRCSVPTAVVSIDDAAKACDKARYLEPGSHALEASAEGYEPMKRALLVAVGEQTIEVALVKKSIAPLTVVVESRPAPVEPSRAPSRVAPIALGAVSGAVLIAGFGMYGAARAHLDSLHDGHGCNEPQFGVDNCAKTERASDIHGLGYVGYALIAAGGVGLAVDIALWIRDAKKRHEAR